MKKNYLLAAILLLAGFSLVFLVKTGRLDLKPGTSAPSVNGSQSSPAASQPVDQKPVEESAPTVEIPQDRQAVMGMKTAEAVIKTFGRTIRTVGRIEYDERRVSTVNTRYEGWIEKLHIDFSGRQVKKGEPLAEFYSPELYATQKELLNALKWRREGPSGGSDERSIGSMLSRDSEALIEAARQRLRLWDLSEAQIRAIEEAGKPLRTITLFSPVSGYVIEKMAVQGMKVMPGEKLFNIADLSSVWVMADVYENDLSFVRVGQSAVISLSYFPGREFTSKIDYIYPVLSSENRTAKVRFVVPNSSGMLKPQMYTNVELKVGLGSRLVVPEDAVIDTGIRQVLYVDRGDGNFEPREVTAGVRSEGMIEILRGLKAGEKVASSATFLVDSEAQLKGVKPLGQHKH